MHARGLSLIKDSRGEQAPVVLVWVAG